MFISHDTFHFRLLLSLTCLHIYVQATYNVPARHIIVHAYILSPHCPNFLHFSLSTNAFDTKLYLCRCREYEKISYKGRLVLPKHA